jgi:hypothetical protein
MDAGSLLIGLRALSLAGTPNQPTNSGIPVHGVLCEVSVDCSTYRGMEVSGAEAIE